MPVTIFLSATNIPQIIQHLENNVDYASTLYLNLTVPSRTNNNSNNNSQHDIILQSLLLMSFNNDPRDKNNNVLEKFQNAITKNHSITKLIISASSSLSSSAVDIAAMTAVSSRAMARQQQERRRRRRNHDDDGGDDDYDTATTITTISSLYDLFYFVIVSLSNLSCLIEIELQLIHETFFEYIVGPAMIEFLYNNNSRMSHQLKSISLSRVHFGDTLTNYNNNNNNSRCIFQEWSNALLLVAHDEEEQEQEQDHEHEDEREMKWSLESFSIELCRVGTTNNIHNNNNTNNNSINNNQTESNEEEQEQESQVLTPILLALAKIPSLKYVTLIGNGEGIGGRALPVMEDVEDETQVTTITTTTTTATTLHLHNNNNEPSLFTLHSLYMLLTSTTCNLTYLKCIGWECSNILPTIQKCYDDPSFIFYNNKKKGSNNDQDGSTTTATNTTTIAIVPQLEDLYVDFWSTPQEYQALINILQQPKGKLVNMIFTCKEQQQQQQQQRRRQQQQRQEEEEEQQQHHQQISIEQCQAWLDIAHILGNNNNNNNNDNGTTIATTLKRFEFVEDLYVTLYYNRPTIMLPPYHLDSSNKRNSLFVIQKLLLKIKKAILNTLESNCTIQQLIIPTSLRFSLKGINNDNNNNDVNNNNNNSNSNSNNSTNSNFDELCQFYLHLNKEGRSILLQEQNNYTNKNMWINKLIDVKDELDDFYYYLLANPTILSSSSSSYIIETMTNNNNTIHTE